MTLTIDTEIKPSLASAKVELYSDGVPLTSYTLQNGQVAIAALPLFQNTLAEATAVIEKVEGWIREVDTKIAPAMNNSRVRHTLRDLPLGNVNWQFVLLEGPNTTITDAEYNAASTVITWQPRVAATLTWHCFKKWYALLRLGTRWAHGKED